MTLEDLIKYLEKLPKETMFSRGIKNPHSYRGYYDQLAFEPARAMSAADMLEVARSADGATFDGWKGGDFRMGSLTECWLAGEGHLGEEINSWMLDQSKQVQDIDSLRALVGILDSYIAHQASFDDLVFARETLRKACGI